MLRSTFRPWISRIGPALPRASLQGRVLSGAIVALAVAACATGGTAPPATTLTTDPPNLASNQPTGSASESPLASPGSSPSVAPDTGAGGASGDIPDNAVFLTYRGTSSSGTRFAYSIDYVEGWQVTPQTDGVVIRDKDSSETVKVVGPTADVANYVTTVDIASLQARAGYRLVSRDNVAVNGSSYIHLVFHIPAPPDPVTGKEVPSTVDRFYVAGTTGLAIVSLSTPDGVDNVDAFRRMITSFKWL